MPIINRISEFHEKMIEWRQDIHSHPELAYQEKRTARKVADLLKEFGVDEIHEGIGGTGVVGVIKNGVGPMIGLRADMDACLLYTSPSPRDATLSRMPSSA